MSADCGKDRSIGVLTVVACRSIALAFLPLIFASAGMAADRDIRARVAAALGIRSSHSCFTRSAYFAGLGMDFRMYGAAMVEFPGPMVAESREVTRYLFVFPESRSGSVSAQPVFAEKSSIDASRLYYSGAGYRWREGVALGEGKYLAVAAYSNSNGAGCVISWKIEAKLQRWERDHISLSLAPGEAAGSVVSILGPMPQVSRTPSGPRCLILFNLDGVRRARAVPDVSILSDTVAILRALAQHPGLSTVGLITFSLDDGKQISAQPARKPLDFPAVQEAMAQLDPAQVRINELAVESPHAFLEDLFRTHREWLLGADLIAFIGATSPIDVPEKEMNPPALPRSPQSKVAYLVNVRHARARRAARRPKDILDRIVERAGGKTYPISEPLNLAKTVNQLVRETSAANRDVSNSHPSGAPSEPAAPSRSAAVSATVSAAGSSAVK